MDEEIIVEKILKNLDFARKGLEDREYVYASEICKAVLSQQHGCGEAWRILQLASKGIYERRSRWEQGWDCMRFYCYLSIGCFLREEGRMKMIRKGLCFRPKNRMGLALLSRYAWRSEYFGMLLAICEEMYSLFPEDIDNGLRLGKLYLGFEKYKSALELGEKLLTKDSSNMEVHNLMEQASLAQVGR